MITSVFRDFVPQEVWSAISFVPKVVRLASDYKGRHKRECPVCGYVGFFTAAGLPLRFDAICRKCGSAERHRQHHLLLKEKTSWISGADVLHFGAEPCFARDYHSNARTYVRADLHPIKGEVRVDIQKICFSNASFDTVICHQVLEHVPDDLGAMREIFRVIRPGGRAIISVPIVEAWSETFEGQGAVTDKVTRDLYFGQHDHLRFYGNDFPLRLTDVGFDVTENIAREPDVSRFGLVRGHKIFIASKRSD